MPGTPLISARALQKTYRTGDVTVDALRGVDLDIRAGEFVVIMGASGNGKTTLLNCCSGIDDIDSGTVEIDGLDLHALSDRARTAHRAARMGFIFQGFNLIPVLSAAENCELPLLAAGARPRDARRRALDLLARVGLSDRANHRPAELSGGEQQRVAIARSLVANPAVIWADEPTGNLDSRTASSVLELFEEVNVSGQTLVVVTHDPSVGDCADRVVTVTDGRITDDQPGTDRLVPAPCLTRAHPVNGVSDPIGLAVAPAIVGGERTPTR
ncbi:MAG: ABC transporter ATP-binding protein [Actinomycetia bacterium]|nr:ABC transporter ATP-binding protein [Actinomycetes bacterium]